jgi:hypothetical protein
LLNLHFFVCFEEATVLLSADVPLFIMMSLGSPAMHPFFLPNFKASTFNKLSAQHSAPAPAHRFSILHSPFSDLYRCL